MLVCSPGPDYLWSSPGVSDTRINQNSSQDLSKHATFKTFKMLLFSAKINLLHFKCISVIKTLCGHNTLWNGAFLLLFLSKRALGPATQQKVDHFCLLEFHILVSKEPESL